MNKSSLRIGVILLAGFVLAGALLFSFSARAEKLTITVSTSSEHVLYAFLWLAKDKGFFKSEGLDVQIQVTNDEAAVTEEIASGRSPIGAMPIEGLLERQENVSRIVPFMFFLYGATETSTYDTHLVVSKKSGIKTVADLRGKTIRVGQAPTQIALKNILKEAGLTIADVMTDRTLSHHVLGKLQNGEIDAAITYYPTMPVILASGDVSILKKNIFANYVMDNVPQSFVGVNSEFAKQNPQTVHNFLSAVKKSLDYGQDHPAELIAAYAQLQEARGDTWVLDADLLEKGAALMPKIVVNNLDDFYVEDGEKETIYQVLGEYQELLTKEGFINSILNIKPMLDNYLAFRQTQ